ncbi:hypothetical protein C0995_010598 [Termitomyces sp. Mi166|nr:hypothetical protein C0995_010598 [Termitomyces sp. Mi166\
MPTPKVISAVPLATTDSKWISLKKLTYLDGDGKEVVYSSLLLTLLTSAQRTWEYAERKTRKASGIDAVAILAILRSKTNAFPVSTVVIEQYRPPIDKYIVEIFNPHPPTTSAGLIDEGETPEQAAIRELEEETGFKAEGLIESSPVIVTDPGMTNANMKLVVLSIVLDDKLELPDQKLDPGEFIVRRIVELSKLSSELKGDGFVVDARLSHFATGYELAGRLK